MPPARRWLAFLSAAIAVAAVLAVVLPTGMASAAGAPAAGTRVGASHPGMIFTVEPSRLVLAAQGRGEGYPQARFPAGTCFAAEDTSDLADAATCGGESFTGSTKVLLASGVAIPIASLNPATRYWPPT